MNYYEYYLTSKFEPFEDGSKSKKKSKKKFWKKVRKFFIKLLDKVIDATISTLSQAGRDYCYKKINEAFA